jgi:hypothetical protein
MVESLSLLKLANRITLRKTSVRFRELPTIRKHLLMRMSMSLLLKLGSLLL